MKPTPITNLKSMIGREVTITGWVASARRQKRMQFLIVRNASGLVQVTNERGRVEPVETTIDGLTNESVIIVTGTVVENAAVRLGGLEVIPSSIEVVTTADSPLPLDAQSALDTRLDWRFLDLRRPENRLIFEIQTTIEQAMREFWSQLGFIEIHSPKFMGGASESGAELFRVDYFGGDAYLAQSPQFYKQMAMAAGFDQVFEVGPVFRANPSFTSRHDTEFTSVDVEMAWIDSHEDVMSFEEAWLAHVLTRVKEKHGDAIKALFNVDVTIPALPFPRIRMVEAFDILAAEGYEVPGGRGTDLDPEGERRLSAYVMRTFGHEFVFVTEYPVSVRPFYHHRDPNDPNTTRSFDLLWKGLEVTTGAQREHRYEVLKQQAIEKGISPDSIRFYLDFFRFGMPTHGGFGFGLTRMLMVMLGVKNVREVTYLYRGPNRLTP